jgi:hypothetical protein
VASITISSLFSWRNLVIASIALPIDKASLWKKVTVPSPFPNSSEILEAISLNILKLTPPSSFSGGRI